MFRKSIKASIIIIYLVIIAGAVVRMTGSGMGCPDWPKCFGYYIPPTEENQLEWEPEHDYFKGQVIIVGESLKVAKEAFTSSENFEQRHWNTYEKHDYAEFNAAHTWIEYINRLLGAISGIAILIMTISSFGQWKKNKKLTLFSILCLVLLLFQAWLGATVVYSVLSPVRITIHMLVALLLVALLIYLLKLSSNEDSSLRSTFTFRNLLVFAVILSLIQVAMGTQVRQFVDEQVDMVGYANKSAWLENPTLVFYAHRSFSIIVLLVNAGIWWLNRSRNLGFKLTNWMMLLVGVEILSGIAMYYLDFPFLSQPLHLVFAALLFGIQFYILMQSFEAKLISKKQNL
ncbi:COX15/CtaA family protein [Psychroflexus sp. CAK57W]|uniref:COX15/CtaA family protein n=1 Tax=Psychroflexus curvus TaxID=2873595 RepID=UPI001CCBC0D5|nr:COX15/CtaA family protein [Psychroflexus curvus]MBZ9628405.1 COX15/CtaA family protein [Psychroflexus curvus]MBZ9788148.1 COX15/CtaA family protein [Psychroflexus curvus]